MAAKKKISLVKNSAIANSIESSVSNLMTSLDKVDKAVAAGAKQSKSLMSEGRRLKKRRASLVGKKKRAVSANKKNSTGDSRKAVKAATSELATVSKDLAKSTAARSAVITELSGLKTSQKTLAAYVKGIVAADRVLARPKKKSKKRKKVAKAA